MTARLRRKSFNRQLLRVNTQLVDNDTKHGDMAVEANCTPANKTSHEANDFK